MRIFFDFSSLKDLIKKIEIKQKKYNNVRVIMPQIATLLYKSVMDNFNKQGTDEKSWQPLSEITIRKRRKGKGKGSIKILMDTGTLRRSIFPVAKEKEALVYTNLNYAPMHQFGLTKSVKNKKITIPARPFLHLRREYKERIIELLQNYFKKDN